MKIKLANIISLFTALMLIFSVVPVLAAEGDGQPERVYQVDFKVLKNGTDEVSAADQYTQKPAKVTVENGIGYVEVTLLKSDWIIEFEVDQAGTLQAAPVTGEDKEADTRTVKFKVDNIREKINARFVVEVPGINYKGEHSVQLLFDTTGMPGGSQPAKAAETSDEAKASDETEASDKTQAPDGAGTVQLSVLKDGTDEPSSLGNYTSKTGQLHERDGAYFLTFTLSSSSIITAFQYESGEAYADAVVLSEDKEADTRTVGIVVTDATKKQNVALEVNAGPRGTMKHIAQIVITAAASTGSDEDQQPSFSDINDHWAKSAIEEAVARGIVSGYDDHTFQPNSPIKRAQLALILVNALKLNQEPDSSTVADQADIPGYAAAAVAQVRAAGLMSGYDDGTFRPNDSLNRAELAVIVAKVKGLDVSAGAVPSFSDASSIPVWAQPSVAAAVEGSLISGRGNNTFAPAEAATRAEIVTLVIKLLANTATH